MKRKFASAAMAGLLAFSIAGCGSTEQKAQEPSSTEQAAKIAEKVDTSKLEELMAQSAIDIDVFELDANMLAYTSAVSKYGNLLSDTTATQADIDAAVAEITELRNKVVQADNKVTKQKAETQGSTDEGLPASAESVSQSNAVSKAKDYLNYSAFSHDGLVEQLEYEKFSHEDAVYGADNCGADWMRQAERKAKDYLGYSAFSYTGLIEQLEHEKFTHDEAVHGADSCGADWNEQAAKKAAEYMEYSAFSRDGLIDQLMYEGFTTDQASHGASSVGL